MPFTPRENIYNLLEDVSRALSVTWYRTYISVAHRVPARNNDRKPPAILVHCVARSVKADWLLAKKDKKVLVAKEINPVFPQSPVFVSEHMTVETRLIFNRGRGLVKASKLAFVWIKDGRVLVKKRVEGPQSILCRKDLQPGCVTSRTWSDSHRTVPMLTLLIP